MTDHNAEGGRKVEPCAWCGESPTVEKRDLHPGPRGSNIVNYFCCENNDCLIANAFGDRLFCLRDWNDTQRRILAQRRKDFEAGQASLLRSDKQEPTFDEYLASTRK